MVKNVREIIDHLVQKPKTLFFIDSLGALITAFCLYAVSRSFHEYFGVPKTMFTYLSAIAASLCIYSTTCSFLLNYNWTPFIKVISIANLLYCVMTLWLVILYYPTITIIGTTYFLVEITIICGLVYIELNVMTIIKKNSLENNPND